MDDDMAEQNPELRDRLGELRRELEVRAYSPLPRHCRDILVVCGMTWELFPPHDEQPQS